MTRVLIGFATSLIIVLGTAGCDALGGGDDAGGGAKKASSTDAGSKGKKAVAFDIDAIVDKLAAGDKGALETLKKAGKDAGHKLNELLKSDDATKRKAGAFAARAFPGEQHSAALAPVLDAEKDADVARTLVETLALSGDSKAIAAIVGSLGKGEAQAAKLKAVGNLASKLGDQKGAAEDGLMKMAGEGEHRAAAIKILGDWKSEKAFKAMLTIGKKDSDTKAQRAALAALGNYGDKKALKKAVFPALKSKNEGIRLAAISACVAIGHKSALPKLKKMAKKDKSKKVKKAAKKATKSLKKKKKKK